MRLTETLELIENFRRRWLKIHRGNLHHFENNCHVWLHNLLGQLYQGCQFVLLRHREPPGWQKKKGKEKTQWGWHAISGWIKAVCASQLPSLSKSKRFVRLVPLVPLIDYLCGSITFSSVQHNVKPTFSLPNWCVIVNDKKICATQIKGNQPWANPFSISSTMFIDIVGMEPLPVNSIVCTSCACFICV